MRTVGIGCDRLTARAAAAGITLALPNQKKLDEVDKALMDCSPDQIREATIHRNGPAYELLSQRTKITRANHENRLEIAKLHIAMNSLCKEERDALAEALRNGALDAPLKVETAEAPTRRKLARFMRRCGIACRFSGNALVADSEAEDEEVRMMVANAAVWVSEEVKARLDENLKRLHQVGSRVQLKNAERQVRVFSDGEEKEFESLQQEYLTLLKEQDELLKEFHGEEDLPSKR